MAWTYLETKPFDIRYEIVADFFGDCSEEVILDLNCGEPRFKKYVKCRKYYANDIKKPKNTRGITFIQKPDSEIDIPCDILCLFGYGGGEYTGEKLESQTVLKSLARLAKHKPEYVVVEMVQKWQEKYGAESSIKRRLKGYEITFREKYKISPARNFYNKRQITIWKRF